MNVSQRQRMRAAHERISRAQQQRTVECEELVRAAEQLAGVEEAQDGQDPDSQRPSEGGDRIRE